MKFTTQEQEKVTDLLLSEDAANKLLAYEFLVASPENLMGMKRALCTATYLDNNFRHEVEGKLEHLMQQYYPASLLHQLQNEIIILDYARYKFNVRGGWHVPESPLRKYLKIHEKFLSKYLPFFQKAPNRFAQYYWVLANRIQNEMQDKQKALFFYRLALQINPSHKGSKLGIAKIKHHTALKKGKEPELYPTILQYYLDGFSDKETMFPYIQAALLCYDVGDFEKSRDIYEEALKINPEDTVLLNNYANLLYKEFKDFDTAKTVAQKGIEIQRDAYLLDTLACIEYLGYNNLEASEELLLKALMIDGSNHWSHTHLGDLYVDKGDFILAERHYHLGLYNDMQFTTREKKDIVEKLEKMIVFYAKHLNQPAKAEVYRFKLNKLQPRT